MLPPSHQEGEAIMIRLLSVTVFAATLLLSSVASAAFGYVCSVRRVPNTTTGTAGSTYVTYYSQAACQGTSLGARYYCSANPTSSVCTSNTSYQYTEGQLNAFMTVLQTAGLEGSKVNSFDTTCVGGSTSDCAGWFYVYMTP